MEMINYVDPFFNFLYFFFLIQPWDSLSLDHTSYGGGPPELKHAVEIFGVPWNPYNPYVNPSISIEFPSISGEFREFPRPRLRHRYRSVMPGAFQNDFHRTPRT